MRAVTFAGSIALLASSLIGSTAMAASTESVAELVCRFGGACPGDKPAGPEAPAEVRGPNRGFSISRSSAAVPTSAPRAIATPARIQSTRIQPARVRPTRFASNAAPIAVAAAPVSRSDLRITFRNGSAMLTTEGERIATDFAEALKGGLTGRRYLIGGHTDHVGNAAYNQALSQRRAQAVVDYLVAHGVEPARLKAEGFGFGRPLPDRPSVSADNRRVEATLMSSLS